MLSGGLAALTCLVACGYSLFRTQRRVAEEWARVAMAHEDIDAEEEDEEEDDDDDDDDGDDKSNGSRVGKPEKRIGASLD